MTLTIASFLAGSLLSMLMPILLLIALAFLLFKVVHRVPGGDASEARRASAAEHAAPPGAGTGALNQPTGDAPLKEV